MRNNNPDEQGIGDTSLWIQQFQGEDSGIPSYENIKFEEESKFIPQPPPQGVLSIGPKTFMPSNPSELENKQVPESEVTIQSESGPTTIPFKPVGVDDIVKGRYKRDLKNFILNNIDKVAGPTDITAGNLGVVGQASVPTDDFLSVFSQSLSGADEETQREMSGFMQGIVSQAGNIRSLTDKVNNNPDDIKSRSELGSLYATLGLNDEARNLLTYSAAKGDAAAMYGLAFLEANDSARYASMPIDKANEEREILVRSYLDDAIKADPKMTQPRIFKASLDIQDGNYKGAEGQIAQVILNQPTNSAAYEMMADLKKKTGDDNAAKFYGSLASVFSVIPDDPYFFDQDLITGKPVKTDYQLEREAQSRYMSSIADAIEMKGIANENLSMSEKLLAFAVNPFAVSLQSTFQTGEHTAHSIRNLAEHLPAALHKSMGGGVPYFNQDGVGDAWLKVAADAAHTYFGMYMLKAPTQDMMWKAMPEPVQKVFFEPITTGLSVAGDLSKLFEGGEAAADDLAKRFGDWAKGVEKSYLSNPDEHPLVGFLNTAASVVLMGAMHKNGPDISALPGQMKISRYLKMPEIQKVISELTIGEVQDYQRLAKSKPSGISQSKWMKIIPSLIEMEVMKKASEGAPEAMKAVYKQRMKDHQSFVESVLGMSERVAEKATGPGREAILTKAGPMDVAEVIVGSRRAQAEKELQSSRESITKKLISGEELSPEEIDSFEKARNQMAPVRANERRAMRRRKFNLGSERAEFLSGAKKAIEKISGRKVVDDLELFIEAANQELPKKFGGDKAVFDTVRKQFVVTKEGNEVARVNLGQVNGFNRSGVSFINPEAAKADTPVHEILAHPAVDKMLEESGMTADQIMEADPSSLNEAGRSLREAFDFIEGTEYFNELSFNDAYKNDTKGNRLYEALVTAVGEEGQKLVTPDLKQRVINFGNKVMSALGLTMDSKIGEITKGVLSKSSTSASPAFSVEPKNNDNIWYHASPNKFDSFDITNDIGYHFGTKEQAIDRMKQQKIKQYFLYKVKLNVNKSLRTIDKKTWFGTNLLDILTVNKLVNRKEMLEKLENLKKQYKYDENDKIIPNWSEKALREWNDELKQILYSSGYDSIIYQNKFENKSIPEDSIVVFSKEQIKIYEYVTPAKRDSEGKIPPLQGVPKSSGGFGPDEKIVSIAEKYAEENKIPYKRQAEYVKIDEDRSRRIAEEYEKMKHDPQNPKVKEAYESLIEQTKKQYDALVADGYSFTFFDSKTDPYKGNPWEAVNDLRANKKMAVYGTYDGFGTEGITDSRAFDNPLLGDSGLKWPDQNGVMRAVTYNDLFRAVHDAFGHLLEGAGFRARGEENAWQAHARLFTGPAVGAMTSETRGQNSWLNFGPYGEKNRTAKVEDTVFGEQKVGLMPEWTWKEGLAGDEPSFSVEPFTAKGGNKIVDEKGEPITLLHGTNNDKIKFDEGTVFYATNDEQFAGVYGENLLPVKILLKNPYDLTDSVDGVIKDRDGNPMLDEKGIPYSINYIDEQVVKDLKSRGFDGVRMGNESVVAFDKSQVKSVEQPTKKTAPTPPTVEPPAETVSETVVEQTAVEQPTEVDTKTVEEIQPETKATAEPSEGVKNFEAALNERTEKKRDKALKNFGDKEADARRLIEDYDTNIEKLKSQGIEPTGTKAEILADMLSGKYDEQLKEASVAAPDVYESVEATAKALEVINEKKISEKINQAYLDYAKKVQSLKDRINNLRKQEGDSDRVEKMMEDFFNMRDIERQLKTLSEQGALNMTVEETDRFLDDIKNGLGKTKYTRGKIIGKNNELGDLFAAEGDGVLYRSVTLDDWERIQKQGFVDSDKRGAISEQEGTNLAIDPRTSLYYLPHNQKGVIIAIDPKGVDLFMIKNDDYLRTNSKIPISNVVKVSEVIGAGDISGKYLPSKGKKQLSEAYHRAKADGTNPELVKAVEDLLGKPSAAKEPTQATEQPTEKETMVGKTVTFEHAGSEKSGVVKQIDNDGNYKVEGVSGGRTYNYTVKPKDATVEPSSPAKEYFSEPSEEAEFEIERVRNASGEDGSTFNLDGSSFSGKVISIPILSKNIKQEELTDQAIKDFVAEKSGSIVDSEMVKPGIYRFPDRPEVSIDLNVIVDPSKRDLAVEFARRAGQESVYDMSEGRSIKTGETGENPVNFTDQQFEIIQEALGKGEMPDVFDGKFSIEPGGDTPRKITFTEIEREWSNIETPKGRKVKTVVNLSTGVKLTEEQAAERKSLVDKIKKEAYKASREGFIDYLGRLKSDGTLRGVIPAKVLTKFTKSVMKIKDDDSYRAAVETLSKIIEDKEYAESIDAIQSLKESVASRMKGDKATYGDQTDSVRQLISIDEYSLSDLNAYHEMLSALDSKVPDIKKASELSEIVMRDASEANDWGQQNDLSEFIRGEIGKLAALPSEQERARGVKELFDSLTDKVLGMKEGDDGILRPTKIESIEDYRARSRAMSTISRVLRQASGLDPQSHEDLVRRIEEAQENFDSNDVLGDFKAEVERFKKQIAVEARGYFDVTDLSGLEPEFRDSVSRIFRAGDDVLSKLGVNDLENLRKAAYQLESGFFSPELFKISARVESVKRGSEIAKMLDETYSDRRVARLISKSKPEEIKDILRTGQKSEADVAVLAGKRSPYARFVKGFIERAWTSNESDTRKATKRYWDVAKKMKEDDRSVVGMILSQLDYQYNRPDFADLPAGEKDLYGYLLSQQRRNSAMPIQEVERIYKLAKPYLDEIVHSGADGLMLSGNKKLLYDIIREINQDLYKKNRVAALRRGKIIGTEEMYFKRVDRSEASSRTRFQADLESITDVINAMTSGYTLTSSATKARSSNGLYWREYNPDMVMLKAIREANRDYHLSDEVGVSLNALKYSESNASSQEAKDVSSYLHTMTFEGLRTELSNYASIHQSGGVLGGFWGSMSGTASTIVLADPVSRAIKEVTSNMSKWLLSRGLKPEISAKDYFNAIAFRRSESIQKLIDQLQVPILLNSQRYSVDVGRTGKEGKLKSISRAAGSMFDAWNKRAAFEAEFPAAFKKVSGKEFDDQAFLSDPEYATKNYDQIQEAVNIANMEVERITGPGSSFGSAEVASLFGAGRESGMFKLMAWMQHYNMIESRSLSNNMFDLIYNTNNGRTSAALNLAGLLASQVSYQMTSMIARSFYTGFGVKTYNDLSDEKKKQIDRLFSLEGFRDNLATSGINLTVGKYGNTMKIAVGLLGGFFDNYVKKAGDKELKEKWDQARNSAFDYFYVKPINFGEGFGATTAMDLIDILPIVPVVVSPLLEFLSGKPYLVDDVITKVMSGQDLTNDEEIAAYQAMVVINNFLPAVTQSVFKKDMLYPIQGTVYKWLREQKRESAKENKEQKKAAKGVKIRARRSPKKSSSDPAEPGFDTGAMEPSSSE